MTEHTPHPRNMSCAHVAEFLMRYLDCELDPDVRRDFEHHLLRCPDCVNYLDSYKRTIELGKQAFAAPASPPKPPEDLIKAILAATTHKPAP
jgi:anti-sigma factor RsiW